MAWNSNKIKQQQELNLGLIKEEKPKTHRRKSALLERSNKHIYKRAHSEMQLLNILDDKKLKRNTTYNFITSGDIDSLSFLNLALRTYKTIDHLLFSTWCMAGEDILYLFDLVDAGIIKKMDCYLGEIFPNSYKIEWALIKEKYKQNPTLGRVTVFKNHSKIFAAIDENNNGFSIQSSANINTNPRTENAAINTDTESYYFYKEYFDGINSFI